MRGDFTRWDFDQYSTRKKHYDAVLHQQGRVWLDADWNEDAIARLLQDEAQNRDIIGKCGTPRPGSAFAISRGKEARDFEIAGGAGPKGHYYVHGVLAQLEASTTFYNQPDYPRTSLPFQLDSDHFKPGDEQYAVVYLEVWRRLITYLEDDSIREIALNGPDTAARLKTLAQVKIALVPEEVTCREAWEAIQTHGHGTLTTEIKDPPSQPTDSCQLPDNTNYAGRENRLYRVEIHNPGGVAGEKHFDNRIPLAKDAAKGDTRIVLAKNLAPEEKHALQMSEQVEISDGGGTEQYQLEYIEADSKTIRLSEGLQKSYAASTSSIRVTGGDDDAMLLPLQGDLSAGSKELHLIQALKDNQIASMFRESVWVFDDFGKSIEVSVDAITDNGNTIKLKDGILFDFSKDHNPQLAVATARFKWSRNNASFAVGVQKVDGEDPQTLYLTALGRDQATVLRAGDWVEVSNDRHELVGNRGHLTWLDRDQDPDAMTVHLAEALPADFILDDADANSLVLRRWDGVGFAHAKFDLAATPDMDLQDGVHIHFNGFDLHAGDFWVFPTRLADYWPSPDQPNIGYPEPLKNAKPAGILRHRCPLAIVRWSKPVWTEDEVSKIFRDSGIPLEKALPALSKRLDELTKLNIDRLTKRDVIAVARIATSDMAILTALDQKLDPGVIPAHPALKFDVFRDCRCVFSPLTRLTGSWLNYLGGDGQVSEPDGTLKQDLEVAVLDSCRLASQAKVQFTIKTGMKGELTGPKGQKGRQIIVPTIDGIARCTWKLATEPDDVREGEPTPLPPRVQQVQATLVDAPDEQAPIDFTATLGVWQFNYVGGDGQMADENCKLLAPLEVAVFNGREPVPQGFPVQFKILDDPKGTPGGTLTDRAGVALPNGIARTDLSGIAQCLWTLDGTRPGIRQTVEARLLVQEATPVPVLEPIHFNAHIERADGIHIESVFLTETSKAIDNDTPVCAHQLWNGIDLNLDRELQDRDKPSRATCFVTVEVPMKMLGVPNPSAWGNDVFFALTLDADITVVTDDDDKDPKSRIHWQPRGDVEGLLNFLADAPRPLLAKLTVQGNFIRNDARLYLDGDSFVAVDPALQNAIRSPSGDGRAGGDFRQWFWLDRKRITTDWPTYGFPDVPLNSGDKALHINLKNTGADPISGVAITVAGDDNGRFSVKPTTAGAFDITDFELASDQPKSIDVVFKSDQAGDFKALLRLSAPTNRDSFDIPLTGNVPHPH